MRHIALFVFGIAIVALAWGQAPLAEGEVQRVNSRDKEITIKHGPIPHLGMQPMTMAFAVKDPAMLKRLKPGDKVKFMAEKIGDEAVITQLEITK